MKKRGAGFFLTWFALLMAADALISVICSGSHVSSTSRAVSILVQEAGGSGSLPFSANSSCPLLPSMTAAARAETRGRSLLR